MRLPTTSGQLLKIPMKKGAKLPPVENSSLPPETIVILQEVQFTYLASREIRTKHLIETNSTG